MPLAKKHPGASQGGWEISKDRSQKAYRAENCSCRALGINPLKRELLIALALLPCNPVFGFPNAGWLKTLKASTRTCSDDSCTAIGNDLKTDISNRLKPGPDIDWRPGGPNGNRPAWLMSIRLF